jgi:long-chain acyl-CoA synthetase
VAGDNIMRGYWNDPEATAQVLEDGWLKTGDVGVVDEDGYIRITDRKRDFIKNSGGETISPARVEGYLTIEREIAQAMVFGDRRPYLVALLVPDPDFVAAHGSPEPADPALVKAIGPVVARVNQRLSPVERVRRFAIAAEPFTIANGQMTPTLKIKRHVIRAAYGAALDALYDSKDIAA